MRGARSIRWTPLQSLQSVAENAAGWPISTLAIAIDVANLWSAGHTVHERKHEYCSTPLQIRAAFIPPRGCKMSVLERIERLLTVAMSLATIVGVAILVERRFDGQNTQAGSRVERVENWERNSRAALSALVSTSGSVKITTFTDFECTVCRAADSVIAALDSELPGRLERTIVHFPLPTHPNAMGAAIAFECASSQGRSVAMYRALYRERASFAAADWSAVAAKAEGVDLKRFVDCLSGTQPLQKIRAGISLGEAMRISGTPAFVINGVLYDATRVDVLEARLRELMQK